MEKLTFGQKLVGLTFNPSGDEKVNKAKELCAELADLLMVNAGPGNEGLDHYLKSTLRDHALHSILDAQMNVVKVLTFKY